MKKLAAFLIVFVCFLSFSAIAQPVDPGDDPDAPIDGGVSLLIAAGIGYGAKKAHSLRKKK